MAYLKANGLAVLQATIRRARVGVWTADLVVDADAAPSGAVLLEGGGTTWRGTVRRSDVHQGRAYLQLVGGAGGLGKELGPQHYARVQARVPIADVLRACGESLAASSSSAALSTSLSTWSRLRGPGGASLAQLVDRLGATWRTLPDGTVWVGSETWDEQAVSYAVMAADPSRGWLEVAAEDLTIAPGRTFDGRRVGLVVHHVDPGQQRTEIWTA